MTETQTAIDTKSLRKQKKKAYMKEYKERPEVIERMREWRKQYKARPEIRERMREYSKEYLKRPCVRWRTHKNRQQAYQRKKAERALAQQHNDSIQ